ncbi:MAG: tRNA (N(6)-L-threonylcarbamoyladenosine(37)-C(2))-methylthiotransferase MtaB [Candidatus Nitrospinota bacterium M3_3B_026]
MKRKVSIETLGCRYNRLESAEMAYELERAGFAPAERGERADIVVVNTCTVTAKSDAKCRNAIRRARAENPEATLVVTGCYSETAPNAVAAIGGVDIVLGSGKKLDIAAALDGLDKAGPSAPRDLEIRPVTRMEGRTNAYLKVQAGCGEVCSFCVIRLARGESRSARTDNIVEQVRRLSGAGVKEVVLTGINLGEYGKNRGETLAGLVEGILLETDMPRIRFSSINPTDIDDRLIGLIAESPRVLRSLHIPLQSGSDSVLRRMRRPYDGAMYEELLGRIATRVPEIGLAADVLVGFPGETDEEFSETFELVRRSPLAALHVFTYSPRKGTEAYGMGDTVPKAVKKQRSLALKALAREKGAAVRRGMVGGVYDVLVENSRGADGLLKGFTDNYHPVRLPGPDGLMNEIVSVRITGSAGDHLAGEAA